MRVDKCCWDNSSFVEYSCSRVHFELRTWLFPLAHCELADDVGRKECGTSVLQFITLLSAGECDNVSSIFVQMQILLALICYEMIIALPQWSLGILSYNLQLFLLVIVNSRGYWSIPVVAIGDCVNLLFIFQQNKSNNNQLAWPSPVVFADIYRSVSRVVLQLWVFCRPWLQIAVPRWCVLLSGGVKSHTELPRRVVVAAVLFTQRWLMSCQVPSRHCHQRHILHLLPPRTLILRLLLS